MFLGKFWSVCVCVFNSYIYNLPEIDWFFLNLEFEVYMEVD